MQPAVVNDTPGKLWFVHVYGYNHQFILHTCNVCVSSVIIVLTVCHPASVRGREREKKKPLHQKTRNVTVTRDNTCTRH